MTSRAPRERQHAGRRTTLGLLRDGRSLQVRELGPQDFKAAREVNAGLSDRSSYLRYFGHLERCGDGEIRRIVTNSPNRISLLGLVDMRPVALAEADGLDAAAGCEIALAVDDDLQGQGIGTLLLAELVRRAENRGALRLRANVLHDNRMMLEVLQHSGMPLSLTSDRDADHITITFPTPGHAAAGAAGPSALSRPRGLKEPRGMTTTTKRTDTDLKAAVADELNWVPSINSTNIGVSVTDGTVTLSGEVDSYQEKYLAVKAAQRVHGVTAIAQEIDVRASSWTHLTDTDVARNAGEALKWAIDVPSTVKASVHDHVVTLSGEGYQHQRMAAARSVRYLGGVRDVINDIHLRTSSAAIASGIKDSIGKAFVRNAVIDRTLLTVSCADDGAVTLEGTVHSWDERGQAEYAAWAAPGVTSVTDKLRVGL